MIHNLKNISLDTLIFAIFLCGFFGFFIYLKISDLILNRKCTKCKAFIHTRMITKDLIAENTLTNEKKYRVVYKCKKCDLVWNNYESEIDDKSS